MYSNAIVLRQNFDSSITALQIGRFGKGSDTWSILWIWEVGTECWVANCQGTFFTSAAVKLLYLKLDAGSMGMSVDE